MATTKKTADRRPKGGKKTKATIAAASAPADPLDSLLPKDHPGIQPTFQATDPDTRAYVGDCREVLAAIPECRSGAVDMIFADPPFNWNRAYDEWDDAIPDDEYIKFTYDWLDLCVKALKPTGSMWVNIPDDWAAEIVVHLRKRKMHMVNWCIWHYRFGQNTSGRFISSKVHVLYFSKHATQRTWNPDEILEPSDRATTYFDPRTYTKGEGTAGMRLPMDVWYGQNWGRIQGNNKERRANHDNQIPEVYLERVIRCSSNVGDLVLDPFLGSGTTCTVARSLMRRSIGVEYSKANAASAWERIQKGALRVKLDAPTRTGSAIFTPRGVGEKTLKKLAELKAAKA